MSTQPGTFLSWVLIAIQAFRPRLGPSGSDRAARLAALQQQWETRHQSDTPSRALMGYVATLQWALFFFLIPWAYQRAPESFPWAFSLGGVAVSALVLWCVIRNTPKPRSGWISFLPSAVVLVCGMALPLGFGAAFHDKSWGMLLLGAGAAGYILFLRWSLRQPDPYPTRL